MAEKTEWQRWCDKVSAGRKPRPLTEAEKRVIAMGEQIEAQRAEVPTAEDAIAMFGKPHRPEHHKVGDDRRKAAWIALGGSDHITRRQLSDLRNSGWRPMMGSSLLRIERALWRGDDIAPAVKRLREGGWEPWHDITDLPMEGQVSAPAGGGK